MISKRVVCTAILLLSIVFKFWLIAEMEITDEPDDPPNYVAQVLRGGPSFFGPGTGLVGRLFPADGIEITYLLACLLVVRALFDWPVKSCLALGLFLFISFNPVAEELFSHIMSDQVWLVEIMLGLSLFVLFVDSASWARWLYLAPSAVFLGFSTITRTTILPLLASFFLWAIFAIVLRWWKSDRGSLDPTVFAGCAACLAFVGAFNFITCSYNSVSYGYFGLSLPDSSEYRDFYMCLQSVGDPTGDKYYPVDSSRLDLVAQAGPVSRQFVEAMRTDANFRRISRDTFGKFDLALPWFHFVVFFNTMPHGDLKEGFAMFKAVEKEIAAAGAEHRLKVRPILPLPDCRIAIVFSAIPSAVSNLGALTIAVPAKYAWGGSGQPKFDDPQFTEALSRRTVVPSPLRESLGRALCAVYSFAYLLVLPALAAALTACLACGLFYWKKIAAFSLPFLARQLFAICVAVFFAWHVLFVASGIPPVARHAIFPNVMLPLLAVYYLCLAGRMILGSFSAASASFGGGAGNAVTGSK
jgi:hypothetical protein